MTPEELAIHQARLEESLAALIAINRKPQQIVHLLNVYIRTYEVPGRAELQDGVPTLIIEAL